MLIVSFGLVLEVSRGFLLEGMFINLPPESLFIDRYYHMALAEVFHKVFLTGASLSAH
jgi:hypothetical protein